MRPNDRFAHMAKGRKNLGNTPCRNKDWDKVGKLTQITVRNLRMVDEFVTFCLLFGRSIAGTCSGENHHVAGQSGFTNS